MAEAHVQPTSDDLYAILEVKKTANTEQIKKSYQRLVKKCHPDKLPSSLSEGEIASATERFHKIHRAYEVLSDDQKREDYDTKSNALRLTQKWPISATLDLDEMTYDPERGSFSSPCRCSGVYVITEDEMEEGVDTVGCSTCTLSVRVLYQEVEQEEKEQ